MNNSIPIPIKLEDLNSKWLSKILGETISEEGVEIEANAQEGSGYLSNMSRVRCKSDSKSYNLIVKLLPEKGSDETMRTFVVAGNMDKSEIGFYQHVVPDLIEIVPELEEYFCKSYYGQYEDSSSVHGRGSVLVLEDLKPKKYYTISFAGDITPKQIEEMVVFLAKFHYAGMVLEEKRKMPLDKLYDFVQKLDFEGISSIYSMGREGFVVLDRILGKSGVDSRVREAYQKLAPHNDAILKMILKAGQKYPCLVHADLWSNNVLFNKNPQFPTKIIDWQQLGYKDPNIDLGVTIICCLSLEDITKENVDKLLKFYYKVLIDKYKKNGCEDLVKRDFESFSKFFYTWGMAWTLMVYVMFTEILLEANWPRSMKAFEFFITEMSTDKFILDELRM